MAMPMSEDYSTNNNDGDDDEAEDDCEETTVDKISKLRCLEGKARSDEIAKYPDDDGDFSLLNFLSKNRTTLTRLRFSLAAGFCLIQQGRRSRSQRFPSTRRSTVIFGRALALLPPHGWSNLIGTALVTSIASNI